MINEFTLEIRVDCEKCIMINKFTFMLIVKSRH
jgi:hypothetical protein